MNRQWVTSVQGTNDVYILTRLLAWVLNWVYMLIGFFPVRNNGFFRVSFYLPSLICIYHVMYTQKYVNIIWPPWRSTGKLLRGIYFQKKITELNCWFFLVKQFSAQKLVLSTILHIFVKFSILWTKFLSKIIEFIEWGESVINLRNAVCLQPLFWVSVMVLTGHGFMLQILINFRPNITNFDRGIVLTYSRVIGNCPSVKNL